MHQILLYLLRCSKALVPEEEIANMLQWEELEWQKYAEECKGMIVTSPGMVEQIILIYEQPNDTYMSCFRGSATGWIGKGGVVDCYRNSSLTCSSLGRIAPSAALLKGRFSDEHCFNVHNKRNGYILCMWNCSLLLCFPVFLDSLHVHDLILFAWHSTRVLLTVCYFLSSSPFDPRALFKELYPDSALNTEKMFSPYFFHIVSVLLSLTLRNFACINECIH